MGDLPDATQLGSITLPGTHDSCALYGCMSYCALSADTFSPDNAMPTTIYAYLTAIARWYTFLRCTITSCRR
jgi:hypothetical protein